MKKNRFHVKKNRKSEIGAKERPKGKPVAVGDLKASSVKRCPVCSCLSSSLSHKVLASSREIAFYYLNEWEFLTARA